MPVNKYHMILLVVILLFCRACIDPYEPVINETQEVMVIDGIITDRPGLHQVRVSMSTPYGEAEFRPVSGCVVSVQDDLGNMEFYFEDQTEGVYEAWLDEPFLGVGKSYSLQVITPSSAAYASDFDTLLTCPPVDSVYYFQEVSGIMGITTAEAAKDKLRK